MSLGMIVRVRIPPRRNGMPSIVVELTEWDQVGPEKDSRLRGLSLAGDMHLRRLAEKLRGRLDIREGYEGLEISSTSFVGRVDLGPLRIAIGPKLPAMPLAQLLRYAYGLRDVTAIEETRSPTIRHGLHDLLIALLVAEVEELLHSGLVRRYIPLAERLESPRGRILIDQVIRQGGVREARLHCRHFERRADWHLNQVLRAGLESAAKMAEDCHLRRHAHQLWTTLDDVERFARLTADNIDRAERELTRTTAAYRPALTIIRLLHETLGIAFDSRLLPSRTPGFLFDMNVFFQRLLSRFLHDNLVNARIADELVIRNLFVYAPDANPRRRHAPTPRPDYALFNDKALHGFLDAKYRDIWDRSLPAEWLYQLSIYALASPSEVSVLLYASMSPEARDERIEVRQPVSWSNKWPASVILRPVQLNYLAALLDPDQAQSLAAERRYLAEQLVVPRTREPTLFVAQPAKAAKAVAPQIGIL
jgi:5-methylcytosine-specific restriction enzyme subunit McrC